MLIRLVRESDVPSLHEHRLCGVTFEETAELVKTATDAEDGEETRFLVAVDEDGGVVGMTTVQRLTHRMCRHRAELGGFVILPAGPGLRRGPPMEADHPVVALRSANWRGALS